MSGAWLRSFLAVLFALGVQGAQAQTCSIPGQAGAEIALSAQPNSFFPGSAGVSAGATSLDVGAGTGVNRAIAPGDLLLIIQMQGADFDASNTNGYGDGTVNAGVTATVAFGVAGYAGGAINGSNFYAGTYEWAVAASTVAYAGAGPKTLQLSAPLANSYFVQAGGLGATAFKRAYQVVRVPQYARATLTGDLVVQPWDGSTGGILAIDVAGTLDLNTRTIDGNGRGFRAGGSFNSNVNSEINTTCTLNWNPPAAACQHYRQPVLIPGAGSTTAYWGGAKGEGTAGTPGRRYSFYNNTHVAGVDGSDGYPNGDMGRGAPGNAGGGGNAHNSGGAGGGNGGQGGNGGNSWNKATAGNVGYPLGGFGGAPSWTAVGGITVNRLFMGGGGGAADVGGNANTLPEGSGGAGGALVILHASAIAASVATINVNGEAGRDITTTDAAGGGGAGGTVVLKANGLSGVLTVNANGGRGGNYGPAVTEQDGAGGGGGGGALFTNLGGVTFSATGGAAGASNSLECPPAKPAANCGQAAGTASAGATGYAVFAPGVRTGYECMPVLAVTKSTTTPVISNATSATAGYVINISNSGGGARFAQAMDWTLPPGWTRAATDPTYQYSPATGLAAGAETIAGTTSSTWSVGGTPLSVPASGSNTLTWSSFAIAPVREGVPSSVTITFVATIPNTGTAGTYHNPAGVRFLDPTRAAASTARVGPDTGNATNRTSTSYGATVYSQYHGPGATNVGGNQYSGLDTGPSGEDVVLLPNLRVLKSTPGSTATAGLTFSYVLAVQSIGRPMADQVFASTQASDALATAIVSNPMRITDTLPVGYAGTTVTASPTLVWTCGTSTGLVTCTAANTVYPVAIGTTTAPVSVGTVTVTVLTDGANCAVANVVNTVTLALASIGETSTSDNTTTLSHPQRCAANLQAAKDDGVASVTAGQTIAYTVTFSNLGPSPGNSALIKDSPSAGLNCTTVTCAALSGGAACPAGLTLGTDTPASSVPNFFNGTGIGIPTFPKDSEVKLRLLCTVTASGT